MKILCVIPSRIASTRLLKKPLLPINGKPMVQMVYENALNCKLLNEVIVATDSHEIKQVIENINGKVMMTDSNLLTGSDRVAAVAKEYPEMDVVINLQGDEPFINANMLGQLVSPYFSSIAKTQVPLMATLTRNLDYHKEDDQVPLMTTLARKLDYNTDKDNPSIVKVITDLQGNAIYFSRATIPYFRQVQNMDDFPLYHHIGLYAFKRDFLLKYTNLPMTPLEQAESLEQLRVLENGFKIKVCVTECKNLEINTLEEYQLAQRFFQIK